MRQSVARVVVSQHHARRNVLTRLLGGREKRERGTERDVVRVNIVTEVIAVRDECEDDVDHIIMQASAVWKSVRHAAGGKATTATAVWHCQIETQKIALGYRHAGKDLLILVARPQCRERGENVIGKFTLRVIDSGRRIVSVLFGKRDQRGI